MVIILDRQQLAAMHAALAPEQRAPTRLTDLLDASHAALDGERYADAERLLEAALVVAPERAATWALVGRTEDELGDVEAAKTAFRTALELDREDFASAVALARMHAAVAEWDSAESLAQWVLLNADDEDVVADVEALVTAVRSRRGSAS